MALGYALRSGGAYLLAGIAAAGEAAGAAAGAATRKGAGILKVGAKLGVGLEAVVIGASALAVAVVPSL